jgi:hypothetical protein
MDDDSAIKAMGEAMESYHDSFCLDWGIHGEGLAEVALEALKKLADIRYKHPEADPKALEALENHKQQFQGYWQDKDRELRTQNTEKKND